MNKKRFTYEYEGYKGNLFDNKMDTFYEIEDSDENIEVLCDRLNWLVNENERLKQELAIYRKLASCGNCEYHNYDWYDDGDEFEICEKGNDVDDRICKDWEEL